MQLRSGKLINQVPPTKKETTQPIIGYKLANYNRLVVLEIPTDSKHNIDRPNVVNKQFAKHRCSFAIVKEIIDLVTGKNVCVATSLYDYCFRYNVGARVVPNNRFDENIQEVCAGGIHFFLDRECAETYGKRVILNGTLKTWFDNGVLSSIVSFKDGKHDGTLESFFNDGKLQRVGQYIDGKQEGFDRHYYYNGVLNLESFYKNGKKEGEEKQWYVTGKIYKVTTYKNGKRDGTETMWHENGQKLSQISYKEGNLHGIYVQWYENGNLKCVDFHDNGNSTDISQSWNENGKKRRIVKYNDKGGCLGITEWNLDGEITYNSINP